MALEEIAEIRSILMVLNSLGCTCASTITELSRATHLSRSAIDRSLRQLCLWGLVQKGRRKFAKPSRIILTNRGLRAATYAKSLEALLTFGDVSEDRAALKIPPAVVWAETVRLAGRKKT